MTAPTESFWPWPAEDTAHVPYRVFTDAALFQQEQARIFQGPTWSYVGLEAEVPGEGSFRTTHIGEVPVILSRGADGRVHVLVNRCAHRGALVLREACGQKKRFNCIYHQWGYDPDGTLRAVPFKQGVEGHGGYRDSPLDMTARGLRALRVEVLNGLVFATFRDDTPPLRDYLGGVWPQLTRVFDGRPLEVLGYLRQRVKANWKLYFENVKDPYHAGLLHLFVATFGLFRSTQRGETLAEPSGCGHLVSYQSGAQEKTEQYEQQGLATYRKGYRLRAPELMRKLPDLDDDVAVSIQTVFPSLVIHRISNSLATRQVLPRSVDEFDLVWTLVGYAGEPTALRQQRILQANLVGPSGYISLEDVEALEVVQRGIQGERGDAAFVGLGGTRVLFGEPERDLANETALRGFWKTWRGLMEL
ncbi:aromatic ring-hydroxylating oxygenase subunit alpha [Melittangium boletus]|uniref:aromatic ring-hydroxylating oxygenase subunit alpha n=1 Tax=Melittangium boletus TaxID=83453 RepID=UPI003DA53413